MTFHNLAAPAPTPEDRAAQSARAAVRSYGRSRRLHGYVNAKGRRTVEPGLHGPTEPPAVPILFQARVVPVTGLKGGAGTFARQAQRLGADVKVTVAQQVDGMAASVCVWARKGHTRVKVLWTDRGIDHVEVNGRTTTEAKDAKGAKKKHTLITAKAALA